MIVFALVVLALTTALWIMLHTARPCGFRSEAMMASCCVLGPHSCHVWETDEHRMIIHDACRE